MARGTWRRDRVAFLAVLLAAELVILLAARSEESAMDSIVLCLFAAAPFLVWYTVEPEPSAALVARARSRLLFPFLAGGASGVVLFLLALALTAGTYLLWLGLVRRGATWLADDDPVQLLLGALYACVYVLLPVGLCSPVLRWGWGRLLAVAACIASYPLLGAAFPRGPREPNTLTELGDPWRMICSVLDDGSLVHYARDDVAVLAGLAALGVLLNVPRVVRRWRAFDAAWSAQRPAIFRSSTRSDAA